LQKRIDYLGYDVSAQGILRNDTHLGAIKRYPEPLNSKALHSCLGLFSYFRKFVPNFSRVAKPLTDLLKKVGPFPMPDSERNAFVKLRTALSNPPILSILNPHYETKLHTDASSHGFGAVLLQKQLDKKLHPVFFYSRKATAAESRFHSFELETLAIIYALRLFRIYLEHKPFLIVTDCSSFVQTLSKKSINPRIARWSLALESFNYSIAHRPGSSMAHVDALSRQTELLADDVVEGVSHPCVTPSMTKNPCVPDVPCEPEIPVEPKIPCEPENPVEPKIPCKPENPVDPKIPCEPESPVEPKIPCPPENSIESVKKSPKLVNLLELLEQHATLICFCRRSR